MYIPQISAIVTVGIVGTALAVGTVRDAGEGLLLGLLLLHDATLGIVLLQSLGLLGSFPLGFGLLQLLFDGAYAWGWQSMILDYLLAFAPLGLAGVFKGKAWGIFPGTLLGCAGRFLIHHISGITIYRIIEPTAVPGLGIYDNPHLYSLVYNGSYMIPNTLLALLLAGVLYVPLKRYFAGQDLK